jgi:3-deoxy-D-manno-octulosonate 8-phosphate phosphatase (KDO 8-P phosphatase)
LAKSGNRGSNSKGVVKRARKIQLLLMDVDGVLTRGQVILLSQPDGTALEIKEFDAHDGAGLTVARLMGLRTGIITGRESAALARRAQEMDVEFVYQKRAEKIPAYEEIVRMSGVAEEAIAYVGDDLPDLPVMGRVGLAVAVGDAAPEVKRAAHYITSRAGGDRALREVVELILKSQGKWKEAVKRARA